MKIVPQLLTAAIVTLLTVGIAIFSVQNATPVSLKFLIFESVQIPVGIVLGLSVGVGILVGAISPPLSSMTPRSTPRPEYTDEDFEFDE